MTAIRREHPGTLAGRAGFGPVPRAEWTKLRTVRGWLLALVAARTVRVTGLAAATAADDPGGQFTPGPPAPGQGRPYRPGQVLFRRRDA